jgi:hypothetical protein
MCIRLRSNLTLACSRGGAGVNRWIGKEGQHASLQICLHSTQDAPSVVMTPSDALIHTLLTGNEKVKSSLTKKRVSEKAG